MKPAYDTIYLAPHLDDVALSCGGQVFLLAEAERPVLIVTVMAGDPPHLLPSDYARSLHDRWQFQMDAAAMRRAEDARACRILGADYIHWGIPDCIYRTLPQGNQSLYNSDEELFGDIHVTEMGLVEMIAGYIQDLPPHERLIAPLGVGNHVDHQLTRLAAEQTNAQRLLFYEDYPYASEPGAVTATARVENSSWEVFTVPLSEAALGAKVKAIAAYESQLSTFYRDLAEMEQAVRQYSNAAGGERLWRRV
ncbi:MAG: PIG-L deacetylase family protein [Candidatus Promineifilaceae bacterium]|jgi:LmbE family N-acetylglucosaminyl deacetylase